MKEDVLALEKARIIKEALKIVDELAESDLAEMNGKFTINDFDYENIQNLIFKAKKIKKNNLWKLS